MNHKTQRSGSAMPAAVSFYKHVAKRLWNQDMSSIIYLYIMN